MSVRTNAAEEQVDAAVAGNLLLVATAFSVEIFGIAVEDVYVLFLDVDVAEEVVPHERMVAFRVFFRQTAVLVHVESYNMFKRHFSSLVELNQVFVHSEWRAACRASQNKRFLGSRVGLVDA